MSVQTFLSSSAFFKTDEFLDFGKILNKPSVSEDDGGCGVNKGVSNIGSLGFTPLKVNVFNCT